MQAQSILTYNEAAPAIDDGQFTAELVIEDTTSIQPQVQKQGFGWFTGVCGRVLLNIFGVMLFLRSGWVVGSVGTQGAILIVIASVAVTTLTSLSLSAIATNGSVKGGGLYFLVSRNLGAEYGGTIGIVFFIATSISVAMYCVGFGEAVVGLLSSSITGTEENDVKVLGLSILVFLLIMVLIGVDWVVKMDMFLLAILMVAITNVFFGAFTKETSDAPGFDMDRLRDSWGFRMDETGEGFFSTLAVFFPAVTGVMAGANISGELRDPSKSIPKGTLLGVGFSSVVYIAIMVVLGGTATVDTLYNKRRIMEDISIWAPLFFAGVISATVSSALASLVGAPRVLQAVSDDGLFAWLKFLVPGKNDKKNDDDDDDDDDRIVTTRVRDLSAETDEVEAEAKVKEPIRAYFVTFIIAFVCIVVADLNTISPLITNFFLISYALVNYACFQASRSKAPGWRPTFKYFSTSTSLLGTVLCFLFMFLVNAITAGITLLVCIILYLNLRVKDLDVSFGDFGQAHRYLNTIKSILDMEARSTKGDIKNYRPSFMAIKPDMSVLHLLLQLKPSGGLVFLGDIGIDEKADFPGRASHTAKAYNALKSYQLEMVERTRKNLRSFGTHDRHRANSYLDEWFLERTVAPTFSAGVRQLFSLSGIGTVLRPNSLIMPYPGKDGSDDDYETLINSIREAYYLSKAVIIPRGFPKAPCRHRGRIDVYWLVDDGGLALLLPVLLKRHADWADCSIRVITTTYSSVDEEELRMTELLRGFRIKSDLCVLPSDWITSGLPANNEMPGAEHNGLTSSMNSYSQYLSQNTVTLDPKHEKDIRNKIAELLRYSTAAQLVGDVANDHQRHRINLQKEREKSKKEKKKTQRVRANTVTVFDLWAPHRVSLDDEDIRPGSQESSPFSEVVSSTEQSPKLYPNEQLETVEKTGESSVTIDLTPREAVEDDVEASVSTRDVTSARSTSVETEGIPMLSTGGSLIDQMSRGMPSTEDTPGMENPLLSPHDIERDIEAEHEEKTRRFANLRKLISEFSADASMVLVSLPVPHSRIPDAQYLEWLNTLSDFDVPTILIRGNGENVMSFEA